MEYFTLSFTTATVVTWQSRGGACEVWYCTSYICQQDDGELC